MLDFRKFGWALEFLAKLINEGLLYEASSWRQRDYEAMHIIIHEHVKIPKYLSRLNSWKVIS